METKNYLVVDSVEKLEEAIARTKEAQKVFATYTQEQVDKIFLAAASAANKARIPLAKMAVEETGMGRVEDKIIKHQLVAKKTPGTEDLTPSVVTGDAGMTLVEMAPYGVIGSITPSTNPSETVICNSMGMIAAGNGVVFNPHPNAKKVANYAVDLVNRAILEAGGPENIVVSVENPTKESSDEMMASPIVKMLVATGGPGVVKTLLSSGKKAIGAGAGNPPVIVDDTADIAKAAKDIVAGASFDNNLPCIAEKEVFVFENVADRLIAGMQKNGCILLTKAQADELAKVVLVEKTGKDGVVECDTTFSYSISTNQELAKRLKGHLLLVTGDMDNNVHPANTTRVVDALIRANKRFEMLILPGDRHGFETKDEYFFWKMADFFSKHLLGECKEDEVDIKEMNND